MDEEPIQQTRANPYGMDEECRNCPGLVECRTTVVHGYGDVAADVLVVGAQPSERADAVGVPFAGDGDASVQRLLQRVGLCDVTGDPDRPTLSNVYLTHLTRCRHPDRPPTDGEIERCDAFLDAELRMINPELIVPVGARALDRIVEEYTTRSPADVTVPDAHATSIRGRGFELVPTVDPREATESQRQAWVEEFSSVLASDYRQTKGRRER